MRLDLFYQNRKEAKISSIVCISTFLEELNCIVTCLDSGLLLHTFVYDFPTPNRVEATLNKVEASNKA